MSSVSTSYDFLEWLTSGRSPEAETKDTITTSLSPPSQLGTAMIPETAHRESSSYSTPIQEAMDSYLCLYI